MGLRVSAAEDDEANERFEFLTVFPCVERRKIILADKKENFGFRMAFEHESDGVDRK